jgi:hypothetical protein
MSEMGKENNFCKDACPTSLSSAVSHKWRMRGAVAFVVVLGVVVPMLVDTKLLKTITAEMLQGKAQSSASTRSSQRSCRELMTLPRTNFSSGEFLTNPTLPHAWVPRADGSYEFQHGSCKIHRYTADEARQCLAGKHISIIGDSVSRFGAISLSSFLDNGRWLPRFGIEVPYCRRYDEHGNAICSTAENPNPVIERNFYIIPTRPADMGSWEFLFAKMGGWTDGGIFNGRLECNCPGHRVENWMYVTPELQLSSIHTDDLNPYANRIVISFFFEKGRNETVPLVGFDFTGCALTGTCRHSPTDSVYLINRFESGGLDWQQDLLDFLSPNGAAKSQLPPVDYAIYNRAIWGDMLPERSKHVLPLLYNYSGGTNGRCFYRTTVMRRKRNPEMQYVRADTLASGCSFFDFAGISEHFMDLQANSDQHLGAEEWADMKPEHEERYSVFSDDHHYQPWLYEEYNNLWLNVVCNKKPLS